MALSASPFARRNSSSHCFHSLVNKDVKLVWRRLPIELITGGMAGPEGRDEATILQGRNKKRIGIGIDRGSCTSSLSVSSDRTKARTAGDDQCASHPGRRPVSDTSSRSESKSLPLIVLRLAVQVPDRTLAELSHLAGHCKVGAIRSETLFPAARGARSSQSSQLESTSESAEGELCLQICSNELGQRAKQLLRPS